jgi:hypothetical protein
MHRKHDHRLRCALTGAIAILFAIVAASSSETPEERPPLPPGSLALPTVKRN